MFWCSAQWLRSLDVHWWSYCDFKPPFSHNCPFVFFVHSCDGFFMVLNSFLCFQLFVTIIFCVFFFGHDGHLVFSTPSSLFPTLNCDVLVVILSPLLLSITNGHDGHLVILNNFLFCVCSSWSWCSSSHFEPPPLYFQLKIGHDGHLVIWNPFDLPPLSLQPFVMMFLLLFWTPSSYF